MILRDKIREMSTIPARFNIMLEQALLSTNEDHREELTTVACTVSNAAWQYWHAWRQPEDNGQEHEWVVFANIMKIAESENLNLSEKRIATAFAFTHDSFFIQRIMEASITSLKDEADSIQDEEDPQKSEQLRRQAAELQNEKKQQRRKHMNGGAENAEFLLSRMKRPDRPTKFLFTKDEVERCADIIRGHDNWKIGKADPLLSDRLAVVCLEGDALWPLHPLGVIADLERPTHGGGTKDFCNPEKWRQQLKESLDTLLVYRKNWKALPEKFMDTESIFRTKEGHQLYSQWRQFWNL